ncbi:hypothetical protein EIP86_010248 [Pleurotus ostreatoroseus]|nr:hypothetical protein EIP86_010248 [Pleurotus ostreatoroseus]
MLWRVSRGLRQIQRAALLYVSRSVPCYILTQPSWSLNPLSRLQSTSAAATSQPSVDSRQESSEKSLESPQVLQRETGTLKDRRVRWANPRRNWPQPGADLVDWLDDLHDMRRAGKMTVEALRKAVGPTLTFHLEDPTRFRELATLMVNTSLPQRAYRVLVLAHELGYPLRANVFESVAHQMAQTQQWKFVPYTTILAKRMIGHTTKRLLDWHARSLLECSQFDQLNKVLSLFEEENIKPSKRTYHLVLSGHLRNRDLAKARACLDQMQDAGFPMDGDTHAVIAKAYRSLGEDATVKSGALNALPTFGNGPATHLLNSLIQLALDSEDYRSVLRYLRYFDERYIGDAYDVVGAATIPVGGEDRFILPKAPLTLTPDAATFTILIDHFSNRQRIPLALKMVQNAISSGVQPDQPLAAAVVRAYCTARDLDSALSVVAAMTCDSPTALRILESLGLKQVQHSTHSLFFRLPLNINVANALLRGVLAKQRVAGMRWIYRLICTAGLRPDAETVGVFLSHLYSVERAGSRELLAVLNTLSKATPPTLDHLHLILRAAQREGVEITQASGWWAIWMKLRGREYRRNDTFWSSDAPAIDPTTIDPSAPDYVAAKSLHNAMLGPILDSLAERQIKGDKESFRLRMRHHIELDGDVKRARDDLQEMLDRGIHPTAQHLLTIMRGYTLNGDMRDAERVFRSLKASYKPTIDAYTILIDGYARQGRPRRALRTFQRLIADGLQPDVMSVDALVSAYFTSGQFQRAREVLIRMWPHVAPFPWAWRQERTHVLVQRFRELKATAKGADASQLKKADWDRWRKGSSQQRRMLLWKVKRAIAQWNRWNNHQRLMRQRNRPFSRRRRPPPQELDRDETKALEDS